LNISLKYLIGNQKFNKIIVNVHMKMVIST